MTYNIIFYEDANGESEIWNFLENLRQKATTSKDARIQYNQAELYIQLLQDNGTHLPNNITKHVDGVFAKRHRKHLDVKSTKPKQNATTTYLERRTRTHENMERL